MVLTWSALCPMNWKSPCTRKKPPFKLENAQIFWRISEEYSFTSRFGGNVGFWTQSVYISNQQLPKKKKKLISTQSVVLGEWGRGWGAHLQKERVHSGKKLLNQSGESMTVVLNRKVLVEWMREAKQLRLFQKMPCSCHGLTISHETVPLSKTKQWDCFPCGDDNCFALSFHLRQ